MRAISVQPNDPQADARSLTAALQLAGPGDVVLVAPGVYSPTQTGEVLPLRVPAGVAVEGVGADRCVIDGAGQFEPSFAPIDPAQSVVAIGGSASLSGLTVVNGGGHGIGVLPGARAAIRDCTIARNGDHGIFLSGVDEATIVGCTFRDNGLKELRPVLPRGTASAQQGHQIFAEAHHGRQNRLVITDNTMHGCFADGLAFVCFASEPDGVTFEATVLRNVIEASGRGGLLFGGSFGSSGNRLRVVAAGNILRNNRMYGIQTVVASPHAAPVPRNTRLEALFAANEIVGSPVGIFVRGSGGECHDNLGEIVIDRNAIETDAGPAVRIVGALGVSGVRTANNAVTIVLSRNRLTGQVPNVAVQAAAFVPGSDSEGSVVRLTVRDNEIGTPSEASILVSDGPAGNRVEVETGSQAFARTDGDLLA